MPSRPSMAKGVAPNGSFVNAALRRNKPALDRLANGPASRFDAAPGAGDSLVSSRRPSDNRMITNVEDYFAKGCGRCARFATPDCSTQRWREGLAALRHVCRSVEGLDETVRWGCPCYRHADRNIAIIGAFRDDFRLSFFDAALMTDPQGVLERQGPNTPHPDMLRFTDPDRVAALAPVICAYLAEAIGYAAAGERPPKGSVDLPLPVELTDALTDDLALAAAFHSLTPGRQRSYVIVLSTAKTAATRRTRIAKLRDKILAGKGATER